VKYKIIFMMLLFPALLLSQGSSSGDAFFKFPTTPFVGATNESFVVDPASLQSILINPANISSLESYEVLFSHTEWIQDIRTEYLSFAAPSDIGSFSLSLANTSVGGIEMRNIPGPVLGTFDAQAAFIQVTYGIELSRNIRIGIAPKYIYEKIFVDEATGYGIDAGVIYATAIDGFRLGCSLTNVGSLTAFRNERIDLPTQLRFGGTYSSNINKMILRVAAAFSSELVNSVHHYSVGGEASYDHTLTARFGYQSGIDTRGFSAGMGIHYSFVMIDYAYVPFSMQLGNSHLISIGLAL
jgi:hypothetical protein